MSSPPQKTRLCHQLIAPPRLQNANSERTVGMNQNTTASSSSSSFSSAPGGLLPSSGCSPLSLDTSSVMKRLFAGCVMRRVRMVQTRAVTHQTHLNAGLASWRGSESAAVQRRCCLFRIRHGHSLLSRSLRASLSGSTFDSALHRPLGSLAESENKATSGIDFQNKVPEALSR